jgi:hypothetical protein
MEKRAPLPAADPGQPLIADDGDELLAERPQARYINVALQAQQASLRHLPDTGRRQQTESVIQAQCLR